MAISETAVSDTKISNISGVGIIFLKIVFNLVFEPIISVNGHT